MKYKAGDKVKDIITGKTGTIVKVDESDQTYRVSGQRETGYWITEEDLAPVEKTLYTIGVGDVITDEGNTDERFVLEVLPNICFLTAWNEVDEAHSWYTYKQMERYGWKVKQTQLTPLKMTVSEIAEKLGHEVEIIK